jgi:DNA-binding transcriptional MerR regulator
MRIGDLAEMSGVSTQTIRFYEREGLLPAPHRESNGYRSYEDRTVARIGFIRAAQAAGLKLTDIAGVLELREAGQAPCSHVEFLLAEKLSEVRARQEELGRLEAELVGMIVASRMLDPAECSAGSVCNLIPQ